jgi:hypothetical protein
LEVGVGETMVPKKEFLFTGRKVMIVDVKDVQMYRWSRGWGFGRNVKISEGVRPD